LKYLKGFCLIVISETGKGLRIGSKPNLQSIFYLKCLEDTATPKRYLCR
jgi:hypothetical protein